jgi:hypothetical protein
MSSLDQSVNQSLDQSVNQSLDQRLEQRLLYIANTNSEWFSLIMDFVERNPYLGDIYIWLL